MNSWKTFWPCCVKTAIFGILSNKLSAIFRYEAKDIADIREISLHETINWETIIQEARQKEAGIELPYITEIMCQCRKVNLIQ